MRLAHFLRNVARELFVILDFSVQGIAPPAMFWLLTRRDIVLVCFSASRQANIPYILSRLPDNKRQVK